MPELKEVEETIDVPKNTGVRGFLKTIEDILKKPSVQGITIDARGKVTFKRFIRDGMPADPLAVDFESILPSSIIRNNLVVEPREVHSDAAAAIGELFNLVSLDHLNAMAFVSGTKSTFWDWYERSTGTKLLSREELFGLPFLTDRVLEDYVLILCASYSRAGALIDTQKSYKIVIPSKKMEAP